MESASARAEDGDAGPATAEHRDPPRSGRRADRWRRRGAWASALRRGRRRRRRRVRPRVRVRRRRRARVRLPPPSRRPPDPRARPRPTRHPSVPPTATTTSSARSRPRRTSRRPRPVVRRRTAAERRPRPDADAEPRARPDAGPDAACPRAGPANRTRTRPREPERLSNTRNSSIISSSVQQHHAHQAHQAASGAVALRTSADGVPAAVRVFADGAPSSATATGVLPRAVTRPRLDGWRSSPAPTLPRPARASADGARPVRSPASSRHPNRHLNQHPNRHPNRHPDRASLRAAPAYVPPRREAPATYDASPVHSAYDAAVVAAYVADASRAGFEPAFTPSQPPREPEQAYDHHAFPAQTYGQEHSAAYGAEPIGDGTRGWAAAPVAMAPAATAPAVAYSDVHDPHRTRVGASRGRRLVVGDAPQPRFMIPCGRRTRTPVVCVVPVRRYRPRRRSPQRSLPSLLSRRRPRRRTRPRPRRFPRRIRRTAAGRTRRWRTRYRVVGRGARRRWCVRRWRVRRWRVRRWRVRRVRERRFDRGVRCRSPIVRVRCRSPIVRVDFVVAVPPPAVPPPASSVSRQSFDGPAAAAATYAPIDGGFGAYSAGGSDHAAGDAGTPRSPHGRPPCAATLFRFRAIDWPRRSRIPGGADPPAGSTPSRSRAHRSTGGRDSRVGAEIGGRWRAFPRVVGSMPRTNSSKRLRSRSRRARRRGRRRWRGRCRGRCRRRARVFASVFARVFASVFARVFAILGILRIRSDEDAKILLGVLRAMCKHRGALAGAGSRANDPRGTRPDGPGADLRDVLVGLGDGTPLASRASDAAANENPAKRRRRARRVRAITPRRLSRRGVIGGDDARFVVARVIVGHDGGGTRIRRRRGGDGARGVSPGNAPAYPRARARGSVARTRGRGRGLHDTKRSHRRRSSRRSSSSLARTRRHLSVERRAGRSRGARRLGRRALDPSRRRLRRARLVRPRGRFADAVSSVGARVFGGRGPPTVSSNVRHPRRDSTHGAPRTRRAVGQPTTRVGRVSTVQIALRGLLAEFGRAKEALGYAETTLARRDRSIADRGSATRRRSPRRRRSWNIACEAT